ncbi:CD9 antigen isoform X2 [Eucyclogobius newberryi]|uniref:CD9 antigen isoform X2 n=1 Tax=Eucyclogobius newberryi TaxID=166745 RepID=UPI003B5AA92F
MDGCGLVCKYIIIIFNVIFAVLGIAFLGLGLWLRFSDNTRPIFEIPELNSSTFVIGATVLIVLGTVMLIVVSFGDYGACSEKKCALQVFSCLVSLLTGTVTIIGVLAYANSDQVGLRMAEFYTSLYGVYVTTGDPAIAITLKFVQNLLHCCGLSGVSLVEMAKKTCPEPKGFFENIKMASCPVTIATIFDSSAPLMLGIFLGTGALLVTALVCSLILLSHLKRRQQDINAHYSYVY